MRGYYQLGPLLLETGDVFGLHRRFRVATEPHFALVLPKVLPLQGYNLASRRPIGEIRVVHRLFEDPTRLAGIRPYQPGDPVEPHSLAGHGAHRAKFTAAFMKIPAWRARRSCWIFTSEVIRAAARRPRRNWPSSPSPRSPTRFSSWASKSALVSNGRDAADRIREEGWGAGVRHAAGRASAGEGGAGQHPPAARHGAETRKGEDRFRRDPRNAGALGAHGRLGVFRNAGGDGQSEIPRDATVVAVLRRVTPAMAAALGELVRRGFLVTVIVVSIEMEPTPDWAKPPDWAQMLLAQGIDFRIVNTEEAVTNLCAEAIVR